MRVDPRAAAAMVLVAGLSGLAGHARQASSGSLAGILRDIACAPASPASKPSTAITVVAGRDAGKTLFGNGDAVVINAGTAQGVKTGDEYYARRVVSDNFTQVVPGGSKPISIHTAGMIRIVEAQPDLSIGQVTYGCDGIMKGDYLERFEPPTLPTDTPAGTPDFTRPAHLILGDDRRQIAGTGDFLVLDRGSDHGIRPGQQLTIFRRTLPRDDAPVSTIGSATVYVVRAETSLVRIDQSTEAVHVGDLVAIHR